MLYQANKYSVKSNYKFPIFFFNNLCASALFNANIIPSDSKQYMVRI